MPSESLAPLPQAAPTPQIPSHIAKDFELVEFLKEEIDKSGELYLKVALWKALLRLPQHCFDLTGVTSENGKESMKQMIIRMINHSMEIIAAASEEGGLDQKKHGVTEDVVRENINWLRQKLAVLEINIPQVRKDYILNIFDGV